MNDLQPPEIIKMASYGGQQYVRADLVDELCAEVQGWVDSSPHALMVATSLREALRDPRNQYTPPDLPQPMAYSITRDGEA